MPKGKKKKTKVTSLNIAEQIRSNASEDDYLLTQEEVDTLDRGIPLQGMLPFQIIFRTNVLPVKHFFTITGQPDSGKSNLMWELMRVVINYGGLCIYIGTETNENVPKQKRLLNVPPESPMPGVLYYRDTNTLDEFKTVMFDANEKIVELDPEGSIPVFIGIDSIGNIGNVKARRNMTSKELTKADSENKMSAAHRAKKIKDFLQEFQVNYLNERPVTICGINHWHQKIDTSGMAKGGYTPGGEYAKYLNSAELFLSRISSNSVNSGNLTFDVKLRNKKQASGPARKVDLEVPFTDWEQKDEEGNTYPCCGYDWDSALVKLLTSEYTNNAQRNEFLDINKEGQVYSSNALECDEVDIQTLGKLIHDNEEMCENIRKMFSVSKYAILPSPEDEE